MTLTPLLWIFWLHFVADFIMQSDKVAGAKSSSNRVLLFHVWFYSIPFVPFAFYYLGIERGMAFVLVNLVAHFVTDYITSRMTSKLYKAGERHWFFVVIGADQAIHMTTLVLTFAWLNSQL